MRPKVQQRALRGTNFFREPAVIALQTMRAHKLRSFLVLLGVSRTDNTESAAYLAEKIANLRIFSDEAGKMNLSLIDIRGSALVVSQFTLYGYTRGGRRPSGPHPPRRRDRRP